MTPTELQKAEAVAEIARRFERDIRLYVSKKHRRCGTLQADWDTVDAASLAAAKARADWDAARRLKTKAAKAS